MCVPAVRVIVFPPIPFPTHFTRRLDCKMGLSRNKGLHGLLHTLQPAFYTAFRNIPMAAVLCVMGECQTQLTPCWIPGCRHETSGIDGGVDHRPIGVLLKAASLQNSVSYFLHSDPEYSLFTLIIVVMWP